MNIKDSIAVVTGGQRGIGRALVDELLAQGADKVYATARHPQHTDNPRIVPTALDVTDTKSIERLVAQCQDATMVINNADISSSRSTLGVSLEELDLVMKTNLVGPVRIAQAFAPILAKAGAGAIVNIHSVHSWVGGSGAYGMSKAALWSATNSLRKELEPQGILVCGVHFGTPDTDMGSSVQATKNRPTDIAAAIVRGIRGGKEEILADVTAEKVKLALSMPVHL
ncbi:SDR family oxidoreductase [Rhodococcus qingshengii]|uniref:SDR family oxidoreductase n=1 Tax=Rhodococcus qingshengii TaxID=334542 RepID=UPI001BEBF8B7|nr:SDR family oxidoreductase [Rhodococcus qingshengii]MBT2275899.1 SDR family oxidoreductase [Rhodococcus qingshengii]